jgi:hypothetical protein
MVGEALRSKAKPPSWSRSSSFPASGRAHDGRFDEQGWVMNRANALVLALFAVYWLIIVLILLAARDFYDSQLPQAVKSFATLRLAEIGTLLALTALFAIHSTGVIRSWRWTFWLILIVFLAGIVLVPAAALQLAGIVPLQGPAWYVVFQAVVGLIQFGIALAMLAGYRKAGIWGTF